MLNEAGYCAEARMNRLSIIFPTSSAIDEPDLTEEPS
jgi:hypothetical protein